MRAAAAVAALLVVAACGRGGPSGPALQITGDSVRVRRGDPLPERSAIFDGETVRLRAARGEVLGVVVWRREAGDEGVALGFERGGEGVAVTSFVVEHHRVARPSTSMYGPSGGAGDWPDRLARPAVVATGRAVAFDVAVAPDAAPGLWRGSIAIGERVIQVELRVDEAVLPPLDAAPRVWAYYDPREVARAAGLDDPAAVRAAELRWSAMLRGYGVAASPDLHIADWSWRAEQVRGLPAVPVVLGDDLDGEVAAWASALAGTGRLPFAIPIDEPRRLWQKLTARELALRVRAAAGGPGRFLYAVTDAPHFVYGDAIDVYLSPFAVTLDAPRQVAGRAVERWTYNGTPPYAGSMIVDTDGAALRTWGWIGYRWRVPLWYVWDAAYWSDRHNHRRRGGTGVAPPSPLDRDAVSFDDGEDHGNLDGVLAWHDTDGPAPSLRLMALRRGLQDRALLELLEACAGRAAADAIAAELVPVALGDAGPAGLSRKGAWPVDEVAWEAARGRVLDALSACPR